MFTRSRSPSCVRSGAAPAALRQCAHVDQPVTADRRASGQEQSFKTLNRAKCLASVLGLFEPAGQSGHH